MTSKQIFNEQKIREEICLVGRRLHQKNFLAACDGNISFRLSDDRILMTPTGVSKGFLSPEDLCAVDLEGQVKEGSPSGEMPMHLEVYRLSPLARAVVHAHPPYAIAWSVARPNLKELPAECLSEVILATGAIPFVPYARPGTSQMAEQLRPFLPHHRALILSRHGALAWGESLTEAVNGMERVDHSAQILWLAEQMGGLSPLPEEEIKYLKSIRKKIGERLL